MKVELIVHSLSGGGAERVAANLANAWAGRGWEVGITLLTPRTAGDYPTLSAVDVFVLGEARPSGNLVVAAKRNLVRLLRLRARLRERRAEAALGIMAGSSVLLALASVGLPGLMLGCEHNNPPHSLRSWTWRLMRRLAYKRLDAVVVLTAGAGDWIRSHIPCRRVRVIPNAVYWPVAATRPSLAPNDVVPPGRMVMLAVGRFVAAKGFDLMIEVFAAAACRLPEWDLVILGEGPDHARIKDLADRARLADRVHLPGRAGNIADWYDRADLFVMSSRHEGLPMVLLEAMAAGVPPVVWDFDYGPRDIISDGRDGRITRMGDVVEFADALVALAADTAVRNEMGARALEVRSRFGETAVLARWAALFEELRRPAGRATTAA